MASCRLWSIFAILRWQSSSARTGVEENARKPASAAIAVATFMALRIFERFCMGVTSSCQIELVRSDYDVIRGHRAPWSVPTPALWENTTPEIKFFQSGIRLKVLFL